MGVLVKGLDGCIVDLCSWIVCILVFRKCCMVSMIALWMFGFDLLLLIQLVLGVGNVGMSLLGSSCAFGCWVVAMFAWMSEDLELG